MNDRTEIEKLANVLAIGVWEHERGANGLDFLDPYYGRRIEADRSWTVYHVFTGVPAHACGRTMTGLNRSDATNAMLSLNRNYEGRHEGRGSLTARLRLVQNTKHNGGF